MKTDALSTRKSLKINSTVELISQWTQVQLSDIKKKQKLPVCWALSSGAYMIGNYLVEQKLTKTWRTSDHNREFVHNFVSKTAAILYCLCIQVGQLVLANKLRKHDAELGLLETDAEFFRYSLLTAKNNKNDFKISLWVARLTQNLAQQRHARSLLEKTLKSAKYLKLWEQVP